MGLLEISFGMHHQKKSGQPRLQLYLSDFKKRTMKKITHKKVKMLLFLVKMFVIIEP